MSRAERQTSPPSGSDRDGGWGGEGVGGGAGDEAGAQSSERVVRKLLAEAAFWGRELRGRRSDPVYV